MHTRSARAIVAAALVAAGVVGEARATHDAKTTPRLLAPGEFLSADPVGSISPERRRQVFFSALQLAKARDARVLPFIKKAYLGRPVSIPWEFSNPLDGAGASTILYGAYGPGAEAEARSALRARETVADALQVLADVGSEASIRAAVEAIERFPEDEIVGRTVSFMMQAGGPAGRAQVLALPTDRLEPRSRDQLAKLRGEIEAVNYSSLRERLEGLAGDKLDAAEIRSRLNRLIAGEAGAPDLNPVAMLDSDIPSAELIGLLEAWRRTLYGVASDDTLHAVLIVNVMINTVRYRKELNK